MSVDKKQFDFQGLITNIKTMINPTANTPDPDPENAMGIKLAELSVMVQQLQANYIEQGRQLAKVNKLFNEVYQELEKCQQKDAVNEVSSEKSDPENVETEKE